MNLTQYIRGANVESSGLAGKGLFGKVYQNNRSGLKALLLTPLDVNASFSGLVQFSISTNINSYAAYIDVVSNRNNTGAMKSQSFGTSQTISLITVLHNDRHYIALQGSNVNVSIFRIIAAVSTHEPFIVHSDDYTVI